MRYLSIVAVCCLLAGCSSHPQPSISSVDPDLRREAVVDFSGSSEATRLLPTFTGMLQNDPDPLVRAIVARSLGQHKYQPAVPALVKALEDKIPFVRQDAATALGEIADKSAVPALLKALDTDTYADVRRVIAQSLRPPYITEPELTVVNGLIERLNDVSKGVGFAALQSLQQITKQNLPFDIKEWEKWRDANMKPQTGADKR
ncbi:MAG: HEAT repeat domain-containing protein [Planctomycetota bacterium]